MIVFVLITITHVLSSSFTLCAFKFPFSILFFKKGRCLWATGSLGQKSCIQKTTVSSHLSWHACDSLVTPGMFGIPNLIFKRDETPKKIRGCVAGH